MKPQLFLMELPSVSNRSGLPAAQAAQHCLFAFRTPALSGAQRSFGVSAPPEPRSFVSQNKKRQKEHASQGFNTVRALLAPSSKFSLRRTLLCVVLIRLRNCRVPRDRARIIVAATKAQLQLLPHSIPSQE